MLTRRSLLKLGALAAAGTLRSPAVRAEEASRPELLFVSALGPNHPVVRSAVSQLLEQGIWFQNDSQQRLPAQLPRRLEGYRAVLLDEPAAHAVLADASARACLQEFARRNGFVFCLETPLEGGARAGVNPNLLIDLATSHRCHTAITHAALARFHPALRRQQLARGAERILAEMKAELLPRIGRARNWGEYTLHDWKAARALIDAGHEDVRQALLEGIRASAARLRLPRNQDHVAGYFGLAYLAEQTGQREPLLRAREYLDQMIARRPRTMGVMTCDGFTDDPLGLEVGDPDPVHLRSSTARRDVVWTEALHMHGPALAALSRATGDPKYLHEAMRLVEHLDRYHLRPDGLLAHCTRQGKPVAPAWARGQTHALYGLLYMLDELAPERPEFGRIVRLIERVGDGLRPHQDRRSGLWRNVIDNPAARLESSGTTGIACVFGRGLRRGWLRGERFGPMVLKACEGLQALYWRGGLAANCRGTGTGDEAYYLARPQGWARMPQLIVALLEAKTAAIS